MRWVAIGSLLLVSPPALVTAQGLAPGTRYDPAIPTLASVVGHDHGEEITTPAEVTVYLDALTTAAPERTQLVQYAETWEGRSLVLLAIGAPARMTRLEATKTGLRRLADPRGVSDAEAAQLIEDLPVVTWLAHGVHGNEISSTDAALAEAYHLLAAQGDPVVDLILRESIVLIDPMQNPDGRARFVFQNLMGRAATPDPEPVSAEHDEPWPGGRTNHYLFDMNRDWFAQTQPESRGRTRVYLDWFPHVVVDLHEMGGNSTYFFAPPTEPLNPALSASQGHWLETFGRANADRFDARGFAYFIRENYDLFYPGYGDSWPSLHGAIGMTYEQASARGLRFRRNDETELSYLDGVTHHFTAAISTAETAARNRAGILRDFHAHRHGPNDAAGSAYVLVPSEDPTRARRLANLLVAQGIEVRELTGSFELDGREVAAGAFLVPLAQPAGRLAKTLLDPHTPMNQTFIEEQDRRRQRRLSDQIYDVTGWSLPLIHDVDAIAIDEADALGVASTSVAATPLGPQDALVPSLSASAPPDQTLPAARVAYLLPWGIGTAAAVTEALQQEIRVRFADKGFTLGGRDYRPGTAIVRVSDSPPTMTTTLGAIAARHDAEVVAVDSGWVERGISLGSNEVRALKAPRVLLGWDEPTSSQSAGWTRYVLERRYGQRVTVVRIDSLGRVDLSRFDVVVLPSGNYTTALRGGTLERLKDWMQAGGTLITLGEASRWAARDDVELLATTTEMRDGSPEVTDAEDEDDEEDRERDRSGGSEEPFDYEQAIVPESERPELTPGSLLRVELDPEHWLSAGSDGEIQAIVEGRRVFTPIKLDEGVNVGVYREQEQLLASGLAWDDAQKLLAQKAFLIHQPTGQGHLVAFAEDPNFRAFTEATELLFMNAVLLGPGH